jgi:tetratricopeptide (TPR) repeat protein
VTVSTPIANGASGKRHWVVLVIVVAVAGALGALWMWNARPARVPTIPTEGLDKEVAQAILSAQAAVRQNPSSAAAWGQFGMVLFAHHLFDHCPQVFEEAARLDPKDARWPYYHGLAIMSLQPDRGIVLLEQARAVKPSDPTLRLRLAQEYFKLERLDEADTLFQELIGTDQVNGQALLGHGQILGRRGRWQEALKPLEKAAQDATARRAAHAALAETYMRLGNSAAAEVERQRLAQLGPDRLWFDPFLAETQKLQRGVQPRIAQAKDWGDEGRRADAIALLEEILREHPDSDEAYLTLAWVQGIAGQLDQADRALTKALQLNPQHADGYLLQAGIRMERKDYPAAERAFLRALELKPDFGALYNKLGDCRLKQGNQAGAIEAFRQAIRCRPDLVEAYVELGALLLQTGKTADSIAALEDAIRLNDKDDRARNLLAQARAKMKS